MRRISAAMVGMVLVLVAWTAGHAADYIYTVPEFPGALFTMPYGINDTGTVVGYYGDEYGAGHGFTMNGADFTSVDFPDAILTVAYGTNNAGTVVGFYQDENGAGHGFSLTETPDITYTSLDYPGALFTIAYGISNSGTIVGYYGDANFAYHGFTLTGTTYASFDYPGNPVLATTFGINTLGTMAGYYRNGNGSSHGFTLSSGAAASVDVPGASFTIVRGINDSGALVGLYGDAAGVQHGFTQSGTSLSLVDYPDATFTAAHGINGTGTVVGYFGDASGAIRGFQAVPDAQVVNGSCGSADNGVFTAAPSTNLCAKGSASELSGAGPWTWTCQVGGGGVTVSCRAAIAAGTLSVVKKGTGAGTVTSAVPGISCGPTCAALFAEGFLTLTANPAPASILTSWEGCSSVWDTSCVVELTSNATLTANFEITHQVTYNGNSSTGGSVPVDNNAYPAGATVTVLDNTGGLVRTGATFAGWNTLANGSGTSYAPGATFLMGGGEVSLYASWTAPLRIPGRDFYQTLADAYTAAQNKDTIQAKVLSFAPAITLNRDIAINLQGGYDVSFVSTVGFSTLKSPLTISKGTVRVSRIVIKQ